MADAPVKFLLSERDIPTHRLNLFVDLPGDPLAPLNPATLHAEPADPEFSERQMDEALTRLPKAPAIA